MIILLKGALETLDFFIEQMSLIDRKDVYTLDLSDGIETIRFLTMHFKEINEDTVVITFNQTGFETELKEFFEIKQVRFFNIIVDYPLFYYERLQNAPANAINVVIDRKHLRTLHRYLPQNNAIFMPHGGCKLSKNNSYCDKTIDLLYLGCNHMVFDDRTPGIIGDMADEFNSFAEYMFMVDPYVEADDVVEEFDYNNDSFLSDFQRLCLTASCARTPARKVTRIQKLLLMDALGKAGVNVLIHGTGWEEIEGKYPNIKIMKEISPRDCIYELCRAKCLINFSPNYGDGAHERIFNAGLNGTVCLTTKSKYLEDRFTDGKDILFIDMNDIDGTIEKVQDFLGDENKRKIMENSISSKTISDSWADRLDYLCSVKI